MVGGASSTEYHLGFHWMRCRDHAGRRHGGPHVSDMEYLNG